MKILKHTYDKIFSSCENYRTIIHNVSLLHDEIVKFSQSIKQEIQLIIQRKKQDIKMEKNLNKTKNR